MTDNDNEIILALQTATINVVKSSTTVPNNYDMAGDVLTYLITLANTGNVTVFNPAMSDPGADAVPGVVRIADQIGDNDAILEVGEIWAYTAQHTVTQQNLDIGSYTNLATGNGSADTDGNGVGDTPLTDNDPETINALQTPDINVVKTSTTMPNNFDMVGDILTYNIQLINNGNVTVYNPAMSDPTATTGPTYVGGDAGVIGVLEVGEIWIYTATHTVTQLDLDHGHYTNMATGTGLGDTNGDGMGDTPVMHSDPENIIGLQNPSINVMKTSTTVPNNYDMVGDVLTYSITLTNNGNVTVYTPAMSDPTATTGPIYVGGDAGVIGVLEVGETWTYTATRTVTQQDLDNGEYTNLATGDGFADTDGNGLGDTPVADNDPETILAIQTPSINVVKTSTTVPNNYDMVGDVLTYNITLTNNGNVTVHNPTMSDPTATTGPTYVSGDAVIIGILEVGETWTFTATHTITQQDLDNGNYTNTATGNGLGDIDGDNNGEAPVTDNDPETILAIQTSSIDVVKTSTTAPNNYDMVGDVLTYTITLTNNGNVTVYNPTMIDPTATTGPTYLSGDVGVVGVLEAGETWTYTATRTVTQQDVDNGSYTNLATGNGSADTDGNGVGDTPVTDNDPETITAIQTPGINVVKTSTTVPNSYSMLGDVLTYAITLANTGNITVYNPTMSDPGADAPGPVYMSGDTDNDNVLDVGETWTYTAQHTVVQLDLTNGIYLNTATGTGSGDTNGDGIGDTPLTDSDTETISGLFADLSLVKTVSNNTPNVGDAVTFTITISNTGPATATGIAVGDVMPNGYTYEPASIMGGTTQNDGSAPTLGWTIASISSGGSAVLTFQATVLAPGAGVFYLNHAEVTDSEQYDPDSQPDPTPDEDAPAQDDEDTESVMPLVADLSLTKTVNDNTPDQGQNVTYTIIVSNSGPDNATGVEVTEHIPAGLSYVSSVPSQGFYNDVAGLWTVGSILNGGSATLTIVATVTGSDTITNYVEISEVDQYDPDSDPNSSFNTDDLTDMVVDDDEAIVPITVNCGDCDVINGPVGTICPGSESVFNAQLNGLCDSPVYTWTVTGNYTSFTPGGSSVSVTAGTNCNQTYTVSVSIECDNCGTSPIVCTDEVLVQDITPPMCATQDISITEIIDPVTGVVHFTAEMINNGSYDACGGPVTLSVFPDSLACEDEGLNIVTLTVTDECGNTSTCTATVTLECLDPCVKVVCWVYLEGSATDPTGLPNTYTIPMRTSLNDVRVLPGQLLVDPFFGFKYSPPGQPYSVAPWNYPGLEGNLFDSGGDPMIGDAGYPPTVVDWVLVSLREDAAGTGGPLCQAAALLHSDGHIEFVEAFDCCDINLYATYYIVIEHRNHLIVMSHDSLPVDLNNGTITYDFRLQQSYLNDPFGFGALAQKEIQGGVFAMFAGNGDQTTSLQSDTDINFDDRTFWEIENGDVGAYRFGDYNLNTDTNFNDRVTWEPNNGSFTSVPRD